jgi:hypothetical protein
MRITIIQRCLKAAFVEPVPGSYPKALLQRAERQDIGDPRKAGEIGGVPYQGLA